MVDLSYIKTHGIEFTEILFGCCCYVTIDSATASSQNGFCSSKFYLYKISNISQNMTTSFIFCTTFIFYHRPVCENDHYITHFLSDANNDSRCSRCRIHRYVAAPLLASKLKEWSEVSHIKKKLLSNQSVQVEQTFTLKMLLL